MTKFAMANLTEGMTRMTDEQTIGCGDVRVVFSLAGRSVWSHGRAADWWQCGSRCWSRSKASPDDDWPPSPALQSLHIEERPDGPVAFWLVRRVRATGR